MRRQPWFSSETGSKNSLVKRRRFPRHRVKRAGTPSSDPYSMVIRCGRFTLPLTYHISASPLPASGPAGAKGRDGKCMVNRPWQLPCVYHAPLSPLPASGPAGAKGRDGKCMVNRPWQLPYIYHPAPFAPAGLGACRGAGAHPAAIPRCLLVCVSRRSLEVLPSIARQSAVELARASTPVCCWETSPRGRDVRWELDPLPPLPRANSIFTGCTVLCRRCAQVTRLRCETAERAHAYSLALECVDRLV